MIQLLMILVTDDVYDDSRITRADPDSNVDNDFEDDDFKSNESEPEDDDKWEE